MQELDDRTYLGIPGKIPRIRIVLYATIRIQPLHLAWRVMSSQPKVPLERRRRNNLWEGMLGILTHSRAVPMRRESDMIRSRMQRWVELADSALGKKRRDNNGVKAYPPELRNNKH